MSAAGVAAGGAGGTSGGSGIASANSSGAAASRPGQTSSAKAFPATASTSAGSAGFAAAGEVDPADPDMEEDEYEAIRAQGAANGLPAWRLALKRPRHRLTPKERALDKVCTYLDKFGEMFMRPDQRARSAAIKEKEKEKVCYDSGPLERFPRGWRIC